MDEDITGCGNKLPKASPVIRPHINSDRFAEKRLKNNSMHSKNMVKTEEQFDEQRHRYRYNITIYMSLNDTNNLVAIVVFDQWEQKNLLRQ
jgi:hypothetical protein